MASVPVEESDGRGSMWDLDQKLDQPMDEEAGRIRNMHCEKRLISRQLGSMRDETTLNATSCLSGKRVFDRKHLDPQVFLTETEVDPMIYCCPQQKNSKNTKKTERKRGTFALYSLLCRHAKIRTIPNQHRTDEELTTYSCRTYDENSFAAKLKHWLEAHTYKKNAVLILVLIGTCMAIGDGILTPAISVLSASGGLKVNHPNISNGVVILVAVVILVGLFSLQHYGTDRVSWLFAPIVLLWFLLIGSIGVFNLCKYDSSVLKAFNPVHIVRYFKGGHKNLTSLGGIMLSITGADIAFTFVVFPCLLLAYTGQAAYIIQHQDHVFDAFYRSIPDGIYWPMVIIATAAASIASQATISATFSIIKQAAALDCFPMVKVVHTSKKFLGQIYIPDINWILMILCIAVTAGFKNQSQIGNAYVESLNRNCCCNRHAGYNLINDPYNVLGMEKPLDACPLLYRPLPFGGTHLLLCSPIQVKRYEFEKHSRVSIAWILGLGPSLGLVRVPGIGFVYTDLASGVPHIFSHLITNLPAIHSVVVFVCVKYLPVYTVPVDERFIVKRIGTKSFHIFRCVARYGYKDLLRKHDDFEKMLFDSISVFVRLEAMMEGYSDSDECAFSAQQNAKSIDLLEAGYMDTLGSIMEVKNTSSQDSIPVQSSHQGSSVTRSSAPTSQITSEELDFLNRCKEAGVVHILSNTMVRARRDSNLVKKIAVDYVYAFLRRICRDNSVMFNLPHESLLNVGQIFYV
ncbi:putative potassium transporter 11 [Dendrobium catenatum]|uniref:Putative potassium transporter 11 n=1 Tax=Dendrobium catenatum TaxID=906689 RepID=A0A2I0WLC2_9ASPA|nr:putative potassium transporter 11 [Dendrobium catenatum]